MEPQELLAGLSDAQLAAVCVDAFRDYKAANPQLTSFAHASMAKFYVRHLLLHRGIKADPSRLEQNFIESRSRWWIRPIAEVVWRMVRVGLALPTLFERDGYVPDFVLTEAGSRWLDATADHPLSPGSIERARQRCAGLPDDVASLLVDGKSCLEHGLMRPAIVLIGVAFEFVVELLIEDLEQKGHVAPKSRGAAARIQALRDAAGKVWVGNDPQAKNARELALHACDFADHLRARRNDAAHTTPKHQFVDHVEAEEFFTSGLRHLPYLWAMKA